MMQDGVILWNVVACMHKFSFPFVAHESMIYIAEYF